MKAPTKKTGLSRELQMYDIEKIDIMEKLLRKVGSNHEPEAIDAARRLKSLSTRWRISLDRLHSTSPQPTEFLRRRVRNLWDKEDRGTLKTPNSVNETNREDL